MDVGRKRKQVEGGVELLGDSRDLAEIASRCRLGESLRLRVGKFVARRFEELEQRTAKIPWSGWLTAMPTVKATCRKSALYHSDAVTERITRTIGVKLEGRLRPFDGDPPTVYARLDHDTVQLSIDCLGQPMHRRGWRANVGVAPLRESLAAALLRVAAFDGTQSICDPFCGSGTIPIEAASIAVRQPARGGPFAFGAWPTWEPAEPTEPPEPGELGAGHSADGAPSFAGADTQAQQLEAARANAEAASVEATFRSADVAETIASAVGGALVVTNLPYGKRTDSAGLGAAFARFGGALRDRTDLGTVVVLNGDRRFASATGLQWRRITGLKNRGLPVEILRLAR